MKIQKISILPNYNLLAENQYKNNKIENKAQTINYTSVPYYNDIAFQARVDKHLPRFFEANKERMPKTVKKFIEGLKEYDVYKYAIKGKSGRIVNKADPYAFFSERTVITRAMLRFTSTIF